MSDRILIEVCVDSVASAVAAERGGAGRVELCSNLLEGGVTPSAGLIEMVRARTSVGLQVMIRPRGGDFCYTPEEFETMRRDIIAAKKLGADGIVVGILSADGSVNMNVRRNWSSWRGLSMSLSIELSICPQISFALWNASARRERTGC